MSSRVLKRNDKFDLANTEDLSSEDEHFAETKPKVNAFALLNDIEDDEDDVDEEGEDLKIEKVPQQVYIPSKKLKKKKKKSKTVKREVIDSDEELDKILEEARLRDLASQSGSKNETAAQNLAEDEGDEFDFEEELDLEPTPIGHSDSNYVYFTTKRMKQSISLLNLNSIKNLDADDELKNLFGNLSLESIEDANATTSLAIQPEVLQQFKKLARLTRGWGGKDRRGVPGSTRKLLLTKIRDDWMPTVSKPMTMEEINKSDILDYFDYKNDVLEPEELKLKCERLSKEGIKFFRFGKSRDIQSRVANTRFYASVVMTPDPEQLMAMLPQYPYHTETLLQVAMVLLRQGGDKSISYALIEKGLFTFDRSFHKNFHELLQLGDLGKIRVPYESFMSRQFYLCIFRNIIALGERSTYFTAFSYCKLLLSLNPTEDPLGVRYFIDHYAIMSEEYDFLIKFSKSTLSTTYIRWLTPGIAFSTVLACLKLNKLEEAQEALKIAFNYHPYAALKLFELIGLSKEPAPINETDLPQNAEIRTATETYLVRAQALWTDSKAREFFHDKLLQLMKEQQPRESNANSSVVEKIRSVFGFFGTTSTNEQEDNSLPFNLIRFAILSGENKILAKIPQTIFNLGEVLEYDILPPESNLQDYNVHQGISGSHSIVDRLIDYVDQNLLGTIIQQRTEETDFDEIVRQLQGDQIEEDSE